MKKTSLPWAPLAAILVPAALMAAWFVFWTPLKAKFYEMRFVDGDTTVSRAARDALVEIGANRLSDEQRLALAESYAKEGYELLSSHDAEAEAAEVADGEETATVSANNARALDTFKKALDVSPEIDNGCLNVGFAYGTFGMYGAALRWYREELKLRPGNLAARILAADAMYNLDLENEAVAFAEETAALWPAKMQARLVLAELYKWTEKYDRLETEYRKIIGLAPDKFEHRATLAEFLCSKEMADYEGAADAFDAAFKIPVPPDKTKNEVQYLYCLASWVHAEIECSAEALEYAEMAAALQLDDAAVKCRAVALRQLGRFAEAARDIDNMTEKSSADDQRLYLYDEMGLVENATVLAFQMANENTAETINNVAWFFCIAKNAKNPKEALNLFLFRVDMAEIAGNHYYMDTLATVYFVNGRYSEAVEVETLAVKNQPFNKFYKKQLERFKKAARGD